LYRFLITKFFKSILFETNKFHHGGPLTAGVPGQLSPLPALNPLGTGFTPFFAELCNPITRQAIELKSYLNHPRIQHVLYSKSKNTFFVFGGGISGGDVTKKACFGNVGHLWLALGSNPLTYSFGSKFC